MVCPTSTQIQTYTSNAQLLHSVSTLWKCFMKRVLLYSRQICLKNKQSSSRLKEILLAKNSTKILISKINILTSYCVYLIDYCVIFHQQTPELPSSPTPLPFMKSSFLASLLPSKETSNASGNFMPHIKGLKCFHVRITN